MAEFKATRAAFVSSLVSLLLSCAMLLGTTYAWFNDSVQSSKNRIVTGNLDIDILMYKSGEYVSIAEGNGDIFAEANGGTSVSWEPGKTEIVYLAVRNIGSLALKYNIKLHIDGQLAGALSYAILNDEKANEPTVTTWNAIQNNQTAQKGKLKAGLIPLIDNGRLDKPNHMDYFAVAVHMPNNTENRYQGDSITVDLTLAATQSAYEKDSFGQDYDKSTAYDDEKQSKSAAEMTVVTIDTVKDFKKFTEAVNTNKKYDGVSVSNNPDIYVKLTSNLDLSEYSDFTGIGDAQDNAFEGVFDGCDHTIENWTAEHQDKPLALFRTIKNAVIKNLSIDNFVIGKDVTKGNHYAVLVGMIEGGDVVIDKVCVMNATITGKEAMGVIVGTMTEGHLTITNCTAEDITIKNAEGYTDVVGTLLGNGYSDKDYEESGFKESKNTITNVKWFNADKAQATVPAYNYKK